jgi:hypothetical protein
MPPSRLRGYSAYLLRLWQEPGQTPERGGWRFSLEDPHTAEQLGFASMAGLMAFLQSEMKAHAR